MKIIKTLTDEDFNLEIKEFNNPRHRYGARGIVFNDKNEIAVLHKELKNEYKLVGGGIDEDEDRIKAFKRECLEECGCIVEIDDFLGTFIEEKSQDNFIQTSFVYVAHVIDDTKEQHLTNKEIGEKSKLIWCDINDAINLIKDSEDKLKSSPYDGDMSIYHTRFIVRRDYEILKYYLKNNQINSNL